jgi:hypothetical protein
MNVGHSWQHKRTIVKKEKRLLKSGPAYLRLRSNLKILIVMVANLTEGGFSITARSVK